MSELRLPDAEIGDRLSKGVGYISVAFAVLSFIRRQQDLKRIEQAQAESSGIEWTLIVYRFRSRYDGGY